MIVTVTPNPSVDRTLEVDRVRPGVVIRATSARVDAGGKGVNVARALVSNGHPALAVVPLGGGDGHLLEGLIAEAGIPCRAVPTAATTRSNITLSEADGTVTKINAPGHPLSEAELHALLGATEEVLPGVAWLVGCGSLPDGAPVDLYATLTDRAHGAGVAVAVDTSGPPLEAALRARPDVLKPNLAELVQLVGRPLPTVEDVVAAAEEVRHGGPRALVVSLGARGAVLVDGGEPLLAVSPSVAARSDVGAGDTLLAGFLATGGAGSLSLRTGVAWAAAAVALPGTSVPGPTDIDVDAVTLRPARDLDLPTEPAA